MPVTAALSLKQAGTRSQSPGITGRWPEYTTETCAKFTKRRKSCILCNGSVNHRLRCHGNKPNRLRLYSAISSQIGNTRTLRTVLVVNGSKRLASKSGLPQEPTICAATTGQKGQTVRPKFFLHHLQSPAVPSCARADLREGRIADHMLIRLELLPDGHT